MVSRENQVILAFITLAVVLLVPVSQTNPPPWVGGAILIGVGVIAPLVVNGYLDRVRSEDA